MNIIRWSNTVENDQIDHKALWAILDLFPVNRIWSHYNIERIPYSVNHINHPWHVHCNLILLFNTIIEYSNDTHCTYLTWRRRIILFCFLLLFLTFFLFLLFFFVFLWFFIMLLQMKIKYKAFLQFPAAISFKLFFFLMPWK